MAEQLSGMSPSTRLLPCLLVTFVAGCSARAVAGRTPDAGPSPADAGEREDAQGADAGTMAGTCTLLTEAWSATPPANLFGDARDGAPMALQSLWTWDEQQDTWNQRSTGADGMFGTADDATFRAFSYAQNPAGGVAWSLSATGAGIDGRWGTDDDTPAILALYAGDPPRRTGRISDDFGPDGTWKTADDRCVFARVLQYDALTRLSSIVDRGQTGPGPDGVRCTVDDPISSALRVVYSEDGNALRVFGLGEPGPDGAWLTDDDMIRSLDVRTCTPTGEEQQRLFTGPGSDGLWDTSDDVLTTRKSQRTNSGCPRPACTHAVLFI